VLVKNTYSNTIAGEAPRPQGEASRQLFFLDTSRFIRAYPEIPKPFRIRNGDFTQDTGKSAAMIVFIFICGLLLGAFFAAVLLSLLIAGKRKDVNSCVCPSCKVTIFFMDEEEKPKANPEAIVYP
jgi:hypothetical protein